MFIYNVEEIFQDIDGDDEYCLMVIPQEVAELAGFNIGDTLSIEAIDQKLIIKRIGEHNE